MHPWLHPPPSVVNVMDIGHGAMSARESPEALLARLNTTAEGLRDPQPQLLFRKVEDQGRVRFRLTAIGCDPVI
jgi:hypothetical protein